MFVLDSHQHFWKYDPQKHTWISEDMSVLKKDYTPQVLKEILQKNGVSGCISVQAEQSESETKFLHSLALQNDFIKGIVGWVDLCSSDVEERLEYFSGYSKLKGFRHIVQDEPDPNFMLRDSFKSGLGVLEKFGYTYDILIFPKQLHAALETVKSFPNLNFVIDHLAKPDIKTGAIEEWELYIRRIAAFPNVYCKLSGMVTEADWKNWMYQDFVQYLNIVFEAFGVDRVMFGSDWPVCLLGGSYERIKGIIGQYIHNFTADDKAKVWGLNALNFYNIELQQPGMEGY